MPAVFVYEALKQIHAAISSYPGVVVAKLHEHDEYIRFTCSNVLSLATIQRCVETPQKPGTVSDWKIQAFQDPMNLKHIWFHLKPCDVRWIKEEAPGLAALLEKRRYSDDFLDANNDSRTVERMPVLEEVVGELFQEMRLLNMQFVLVLENKDGKDLASKTNVGQDKALSMLVRAQRDY